MLNSTFPSKQEMAELSKHRPANYKKEIGTPTNMVLYTSLEHNAVFLTYKKISKNLLMYNNYRPTTFNYNLII